MNQGLLLTYTKFPKDFVENILDVDASQQASQRIGGSPEFLRNELLTSVDRLHAALQRTLRCAQQLALPLAGDHADIARTKIILGVSDQCRDQTLKAVASFGRNPEVRAVTIPPQARFWLP